MEYPADSESRQPKLPPLTPGPSTNLPDMEKALEAKSETGLCDKYQIYDMNK